jgi:hypothetical protein
MNGKPWTPEQTAELRGLIDTIMAESGGDKISAEAPTLVLFSTVHERTPLAVSHKVRMLALKDGKIKTRRMRKLEEAQAQMPIATLVVDEPTPEPEPVTAQVVSIPLRKLYGKIDFETFMSLING